MRQSPWAAAAAGCPPWHRDAVVQATGQRAHTLADGAWCKIAFQLKTSHPGLRPFVGEVRDQNLAQLGYQQVKDRNIGGRRLSSVEPGDKHESEPLGGLGRGSILLHQACRHHAGSKQLVDLMTVLLGLGLVVERHIDGLGQQLAADGQLIAPTGRLAHTRHTHLPLMLGRSVLTSSTNSED